MTGVEQQRLALSPQEQQRWAEVVRLRARGASGVGELVGMLTDPSWAVRREVVAALGALGAPAVGPLCQVLELQRDDEARIAAAVDALVASSSDVQEQVQGLAVSKDPAVAADAAQILGRRRSGKAVPVLAELATHRDDNVAVAAIEALGRVGGRAAVDALLAAAGSGQFFRVYPTIDVLGRTEDPRAVPALARLLGQPMYVLEAARALGRGSALAAVAPLARLLTAPSDVTVRVAAVALAELAGRRAERYGAQGPLGDALRRATQGDVAVRHLAQALTSADEDERVAIARVLGWLGGEHATSALGRLLAAGGRVAETAAIALKAIGPSSDQELRAALAEGPSERRAVILPLATRAMAHEIALCLDDPEPGVRAQACDALARLGATAAVPRLFELLADRDAHVSQAALGAIQSLGSAETKGLALAAAGSADPLVRRAGLRILAYFGFDEGLPRFLEAIRQEDDATLREAAIAGLPFLDHPGALEALLGTARDAVARTRSAAMRAIGHCATQNPRLTSTLLEGLNDADAWVRYYAAQALGRLGFEAGTTALADRLGDPAGQVRVAAIEALSHFQNRTAVEALRKAAEGEDADLKRAALIGLGIARNPETMPVLEAAVASADPATRLVAISAVVDSSSPSTVPVLARAVRDADENVRAAAVGFLGALPGPEPVRVLVELGRRSEERDRVLTMLSMPADGRAKALLEALGEADDEVAPLIANALARLSDAGGEQALATIFAGAALPARKAAASALAALGTREAQALLRRAADADPDPRVRQICAVLLVQ
jgi:HEAT repeat protein